MPEALPELNNESRPRVSLFPNPFAYRRWKREEQFRREREELSAYFQKAAPVAILVQGYYEKWREAISEPIQDGQKAANISANFWWQVAERLRRFRVIVPPKPAERYHKLFDQALASASEGADIAKSGFRFSKFYVVSRGMGYLDKYVELMAEAEQELGRLVQKYRLIEDPVASAEEPAGEEIHAEGQPLDEPVADGATSGVPMDEEPHPAEPSDERLPPREL
jgi:hypothetical protein